MCGIFGCLGEVSAARRATITQSLFHRGPDKQAFASVSNFTLFHSRLSIIDSEGGNQPFVTDTVALVFNGEIYNYKELIKEYQLKVNSKSDTEVIIRLYEKLGRDSFQFLDGMFAFGLLDLKTNDFFLVRDRAGKKPLYYTQGTHFMFSSEMKALFAAGFKTEIHTENIKMHLQKGFVAGEQTIYESIYEVLPGHFYHFSPEGNLNSKFQYWSYRAVLKNTQQVSNEQEGLSLLDSKLHAAVEKRMLASDLEVGAFLSGGIDSSLVCSHAVKINPNLRTFTVQTSGSFDESTIAAAIAKELKTNHTVLKIDASNLKNDYTKILSAYDEPIIDESIIPSYYVAQEAKKHVTVILNGDGGDEVMAGYRRHLLYKYYHSLQMLKFPISLMQKMFPTTEDKMSWKNYIKRLHSFATLDESQKYFSATTDLFYDAPGFREPVDLYWNQIVEESSNLNTSLDQILYLDFMGILPKILLKKIDISTMQHAIEGRSPFLDTNFIEATASIPQNLKIKGITSKYLLRKLVQQKIPGDFHKLPKRGFEISVQKLLETDLKEMANDLLYSKSPFYKELLDETYITKYYLQANSKIDEIKRYKGIFTLLNLEIWHQNFKNEVK